MSEYLSRFTPSRTDARILEAIFVQREQTAQDALAKLVDGITSGNKYHLLYVGPRGSGKTHLVTLLFNRLNAMEALRDKVRVAWLGEDETSTSYLKLMIRVHRALNARYPTEFPLVEPRSMPATDEAGRTRVVERWLVERLEGRALLVIVENLDSLMGSLGDTGQKQWRAFLQNHAITNTLATAQQLTRAMYHRASAFHGFFHTTHLEPLALGEAVQLLAKIAESVTKDPDLAAMIQSERGKSRVRAIDHLTGGSHRLYIMLSEFLTIDALTDLVRPFEELIDELTPYYQERLRALPGQQREIVEYLALSPTTAAVKTIANDLMMTSQVVSGQLNKLAANGYVRNDRHGRESLYELAEPLMRVCVEVKENGTAPIRLLVEFLRNWFNKEELEASLKTLPATSKAIPYARLAIAGYQRSQISRSLAETEAAGQAGSANLSLETLQRRAESESTFEAWRALGLAQRAAILWETALNSFEKALTFKDDPDIWYHRGFVLGNLGRHEEALSSYDRAVSADPGHAIAWSNRGDVLSALGRHEEALSSLDRAVSADPGDAGAWSNRGNVLSALGRHEEALSSLDRAVSADPGHAIAWSNRGVTLRRLGRHDEAIASEKHAREMVRTAYERLYVAHNVGRERETLLRETLRRYQPSHWSEVEEASSIVARWIEGVKDPGDLIHEAQRLIEAFAGARELEALGSMLVESLKSAPGAGRITALRKAWAEAGAGYEALKLPLRLYDAGMRYRETGDPGELLTLVSSERSIVAEALGLEVPIGRKRRAKP